MQLDCKCADPSKSTALTARKVGFFMQLQNQVDKQGSRPQVLFSNAYHAEAPPAFANTEICREIIAH